MNKYLLYIYIPFALGLDLYSTYWASNGDINNIIELHFLSSVFGKGFTGLSIVFFIESIILLFLLKISINSAKNNYIHEYKILKIEKRKNILDVKKIINSMPVIVLIICTSHVIFSLNNFLLGFYLRGSSSKFVIFYIKYVHIEQRIYLIHIIIMIITTVIIFCFLRKKNK